MSAQISLKLECQGCGSTLEYSPGEQALRCPYCSAVTDIPVERETAPEEADLVIPLTVDLAALTDVVHQHLASGDLTPDHLLTQAAFTKRERFYAPVFLFTGSFQAHWTASFGFDRWEQYVSYETRYENGRSRREPVTRTKLVTDWKPVNGTTSGAFTLAAYAGKRLLAANHLLELVEVHAPLQKAVPFDPGFAAGVGQERFALTETAAWQSRAADRFEGIIEGNVKQHAQGDRQRDWHWTKRYKGEAATVLVPVCHVVYEFEGRPYNIWVSGTDPSRFHADPLPVDTRRRWRIRWGYAPLAAAALATYVALTRGADPPYLLPGVPLTFLYAWLRSRALIEQSRRVRQATLAGKRAAAATGKAAAELLQAARAGAATPFLLDIRTDRIAVAVLSVLASVFPFGSFLWGSGPAPSLQEAAAAAPTLVEQPAPAPEPAARHLAHHGRTRKGAHPAGATVQGVQGAGVAADADDPAAPAVHAQTSSPGGNEPAPQMTTAQETAAAPSVPSYNCAKAKGRVELFICGSEDLSKLDRELAALYQSNLAAAGPDGKRQLLHSQRAFITARNRCDSEACVADAYRVRFEELGELGYVHE